MISPSALDLGLPVGAARVPGTRRLKILVVDDEAPVCEVLAELLKCDGHEVEDAADGPSALEKFRRRQADVVLTDFKMPGMDGSQLAAEIKRLAPGVPVILVTGAKPRIIDTKAIDAVVEKPFTYGGVAEAIDRALRPQAA